jgi:hypothetical protein
MAGTEWRLVAFQSMDDAQGERRPDARSKYTMRLDPDGSVQMQLNCNRARGTWRAEPASDRVSGRFEFGPLASTRALCPPPSLDEFIVSQAQYVRGYLIRDGLLNLSLMADGGIFIWEPADIEVPFQATPDRTLEDAVRAAAPTYTTAVDEPGFTGRARYIYTRFDLNEDGRPEVFVYLMGSFFCGTGGCTLMLFTPTASGYRLVNDFPISRPPVILSPSRTAGWHDLIRIESGGGAAPTNVRHVFDGGRYVLAERTPAGTEEPEGKLLLTGELGPTVGTVLEPRR